MTGRDELHRWLPGAATLLDDLVAHSPIDARRTGLIRSTTARVHGLAPLPTGHEDEPGDADDHVLAFARQFATDVSAISDTERADFLTAAGADAFAIVVTVYVADMVPRLDATLDALFGTSAPRDTRLGLVDVATTWATVEEFLRVVHNHHTLDEVLAEVVRLRGARAHDCRRCQALRSRPAVRAGATEELFDALDEPGLPRFDARTRAAVALTDTMVWTPARMPDGLADDLHEQFTPEQLVELVLDVVRNGANKIAVALGADAPTVTEGVDLYEIDEAGVAHHGLTLD